MVLAHDVARQQQQTRIQAGRKANRLNLASQKGVLDTVHNTKKNPAEPGLILCFRPRCELQGMDQFGAGSDARRGSIARPRSLAGPGPISGGGLVLSAGFNCRAAFDCCASFDCCAGFDCGAVSIPGDRHGAGTVAFQGRTPPGTLDRADGVSRSRRRVGRRGPRPGNRRGGCWPRLTGRLKSPPKGGPFWGLPGLPRGHRPETGRNGPWKKTDWGKTNSATRSAST